MNKKQIKSRYIIDASGYGRVLPGLLNLDKPSNFPPRSAMFTHFKDPNRPNGDDKNRIIIIAPNVNASNKNKICSVLAGYVWDQTNPYVKKHKRILDTLARVIQLETNR